jgi:hypothetical protein
MIEWSQGIGRMTLTGVKRRIGRKPRPSSLFRHESDTGLAHDCILVSAVTSRRLTARTMERRKCTESWAPNKLQVPAEWPLRPHFHTWPPQRHGAILRILAHLVYYRTQHCHQQTLADYADFMRRARWKAYWLSHRLKRVGNYLTVL